MRILVTGGAGFIGSHVVNHLIDNGIDTDILVSGFRSSKHMSDINKNANIIKGDLRNYDTLVDATKNVDFVFHLGAFLSHYCDKYPNDTIDVNIKGMLNLKKACVANGVDRIVFASSSFIYGDTNCESIDEEHPTNVKDLFGITKLAGEKILQIPYPESIKYTILRMFNVYGPNQYSDDYYTSVTSTWIQKALNGKPLEIHDDGKQALDFVYAGDVAKAFIASINKRAENQIFNVGSGRTISMNELAALINKLTDNKAPSFYNKGHPKFLRHVQADINKIKSYLYWEPKVSMEEGLKNTIDFYKKQSQAESSWRDYEVS